MKHGKAALTDPYADLARELKDREKPQRQPLSIMFVVFMLLLTSLCVGLGFWQLQRLEQKQTLIAAVADRASLKPIELPPVAEWQSLEPAVYDFRPVTLTGKFDHQNVISVFTALYDARGDMEGPGFWIMTPFKLDSGGTIIVNRGFVPQSSKDLFASTSQGIEGIAQSTTITGIARKSEQVGPFTPGPDISNRVEYVRSIDRLSAMMGIDHTLLPQIYVDQVAGEKGVLPQGGETKMTFPNRHLGYAITWFGLAAVAAIMTLYWLWRQRRA